uniref:cdc42 effector protein 3-like n=1 Tax=Danio rerio TaxID=7955 RepID=UPI003D972E77
MPLWTSQQRKPAPLRWRASGRRNRVSLNMISLPLADFKHLSHIGLDGHTDSFGDLSFLKEGHNLLHQSSRSEQNLFLACAPPPKPPRVNLEEPIWEKTASERRQKSSSLPLLDMEDEDEEQYPKTLINTDQTQTDQIKTDQTQTDQTDSAFTFSLDLGPSILDAVLQVMEKSSNRH